MLAASAGPIGPAEAAARGVFGPVRTFQRAQLRSFHTHIHVTLDFRWAAAWTHVPGIGRRDPGTRVVLS